MQGVQYSYTIGMGTILSSSAKENWRTVTKLKNGEKTVLRINGNRKKGYLLKMFPLCR